MQRKVTLRDLREGTVTEAEFEEIRASLTAPGKALSADGIGPMVIQALLNFQEAGRVWEQEAKSLYAILDMTIDEADAYIKVDPSVKTILSRV